VTVSLNWTRLTVTLTAFGKLNYPLKLFVCTFDCGWS